MATSRWFRFGANRSVGGVRRRNRRTLSLLALEDRTVPAGILDSGFETPVLTAGTFQYGPAGAPWIFSSGAGISTNNSGFTSGNPPAPEGNQVALLQRQATITQNVTFDAGTYTISFSAAQRGNVPSAQTFQVLIDNTVVGTFNSLTGKIGRAHV